MKIQILLFVLSQVVLSSCGDCGKSINLGKLVLDDISKSSIPYSGDEELIFEDQDGLVHRLTSPKGKVKNTLRMHVNTLCDEGVLDKQHEYFDIDTESIAFHDKNDKQVFYTTLTTRSDASFSEIFNLDSLFIYDYLSINSNVGIVNIITKEKKNHLYPEYESYIRNRTRYIGDTILYNVEFKDVFVGIRSQKAVYYNKKKGVLALKKDEENYWILKGI